MNMIKDLLGPMRPPFLILTPACVLLGVGTAAWRVGNINITYLVLVFIGAISAHISVNALNEYYDFKSGLDFRTRKTPFSGGSGTLPASPETAKSALFIGLLTLAITGLIGIYFLYARGLKLLPLGVLGIIIIFAYTKWIIRSPVLCLIAPGLGFGPLMVVGTDFCLAGSYSWIAFLASMLPFFLVSDLLLLNQFPDADADQSVGRRHLPIVVGKPSSAVIYGIFLICAYIPVIIGCALGYLPKASLLGLASVVLAIPAIIGVIRYARDIEKLIPYMGLNVVINITTPVLVAIGLFISI
ncbi:MAG: prenyltransferase [Thermodesulfobacteriota bacterium]|nr:prenyltransferase [Thermodesulfobacteriota bacterium]